jgi:hypothetical protein
MKKYTYDEAKTAFWEKVDKTDTCWNWNAATWGNNQYGCARWGGRCINAHRVSWSLTHGEIPKDLKVLHRCDNPLCVNPDHLFLGTQKDNCQDAKAKGRTSNQHVGVKFCKRGHEFTQENTRLDGRGRQCKICDKIRYKGLLNGMA